VIYLLVHLFLGSGGMWVTYAVFLLLLHLFLLSVPFLSIPIAWTLTNVVHNVVSMNYHDESLNPLSSWTEVWLLWFLSVQLLFSPFPQRGPLGNTGLSRRRSKSNTLGANWLWGSVYNNAEVLDNCAGPPLFPDKLLHSLWFETFCGQLYSNVLRRNSKTSFFNFPIQQ